MGFHTNSLVVRHNKTEDKYCLYVDTHLTTERRRKVSDTMAKETSLLSRSTRIYKNVINYY